MTNFAYLRVSTDDRDETNQKLGVLEYCNSTGITPLTFVEDTVTGKKSWKARRIGQILQEADAGDRIIVSEVSRIARSTLQVLEMLQEAAEKEISVHIAKNRMIMDGSMQATIIATVLGLAAQIEREFIAARTKEALAVRKAKGLPLGRPKGPAETLKLDEHKDQIVEYLQKGVSKRSIARILDCSHSTLYEWLKRRKIRVPRKK